MKVLHVITGLHTGGAETALCRLLETLRPPEFEHSVVALRGEGPLSARVRAAGARVTHLNMRPSTPNPFGALRLWRLQRTEGLDVVQGWMSHANLAATLTRPAAGAPVVWGIRHTPYDLADEKPLTRLVLGTSKALAKRATAIVYNSTVSARRHEALGYPSDRTRVIPNGFDTAIFKPDPVARCEVRAELALSPEAFVVGLVARWHPMKDHENFLRAAALLSKSRSDAMFVMVGDGVDAGNGTLRELIRALGLSKCVRLCGPRRDVAALNAALDVGSSSSWGEAFPNAIGEAMSCGIPCVATDVGDIREIVANTGVVVPPRDPQALCAGWLEFARMDTSVRRALGEDARQRVMDRYSLSEVGRRYAALYAEVAPLLRNKTSSS